MKDKTLEACLKLIEEKGWKAFSFAKASEESGIPLEKFHGKYSCPSDVLVQLFRHIDDKVMKNVDMSKDTPPKDALFDILMARFDASLPFKKVIKNFWHEWYLAPEESPNLLCQGYSSMTWMLELAGLSTRGLTGMLRVQGLTTLYLLTLRTWLDDDSPDLGKTMVYLDKGLTNLEKAAGILKFL